MSLVFWWRRRVYGGSCKTCLFGMFQTVKIGGSLARNAGFDVPTCLVSSLCGFPVASPCLWGKLQNSPFRRFPSRLSCRFDSFCVAGVALCDIPTCLTTCRKCQNWRKSRTKCSFFCIHASCLESLVFLWRRRVYGASCKTSLFRRFPSRLSCRFAWQVWHFVTFQPV